MLYVVNVSSSLETLDFAGKRNGSFQLMVCLKYIIAGVFVKEIKKNDFLKRKTRKGRFE